MITFKEFLAEGRGSLENYSDDETQITSRKGMKEFKDKLANTMGTSSRNISTELWMQAEGWIMRILVRLPKKDLEDVDFTAKIWFDEMEKMLDEKFDSVFLEYKKEKVQMGQNILFLARLK
jgi:hypothetical protein